MNVFKRFRSYCERMQFRTMPHWFRLGREAIDRWDLEPKGDLLESLDMVCCEQRHEFPEPFPERWPMELLCVEPEQRVFRPRNTNEYAGMLHSGMRACPRPSPNDRERQPTFFVQLATTRRYRARPRLTDRVLNTIYEELTSEKPYIEMKVNPAYLDAEYEMTLHGPHT